MIHYPYMLNELSFFPKGSNLKKVSYWVKKYLVFLYLRNILKKRLNV